MICVHCNETIKTISVWRLFSIRLDGGFKCSVCGKVSFTQSIRPDLNAAIMFLGYTAALALALVLVLFLTRETWTERLMLIGALVPLAVILMGIVLAGRASQRIVTVASRPPRPIRQQRWFRAAWLVFFISILLGDLVMGWSYVSLAAMMIAALFYIVGCLSGGPSRTRPTDPFKQD